MLITLICYIQNYCIFKTSSLVSFTAKICHHIFLYQAKLPCDQQRISNNI